MTAFSYPRSSLVAYLLIFIARKKFNPKEEMKTLYWNRIQIFE